MKIAIRLTTCLCLLWSYASFGQTSSIQGNVKDNEGKNLEFVHVFLKGTSRGSKTDSTGKYQIKNIPNGTYTLMVTSVGYISQQKNIQLTEATNLNFNFVLQIDTAVQEVVVEGTQDSYVAKQPSTTMRIETPLIEQAQNIQVISAAAIQDQQTFNLLEGVQRNVSGAQKIEHWDIYARINMRGSQVTPFRNGVNLQLSPWSPLAEDMCFVDRIEFIKGPASYMLSASEPGGFYNIVTKQPTGMNRGNVGFTMGSFNTYRTTIDLDGKVTNKLLFRMNAMGQLKDSHRDFEYQNRYTFAPVLKYLINDNTSVTLEYNEQYAQTSAIGSNYAFSNRGYGDLPVNFTTLEKNLAPTVMRDRMVMARLEHKINNHWKATAQLSYLHYKQVGQSLWPYVGFDATNDSLLQRFVGIWDALGTSKNGQFYLNGDFMTKSIRHRVLAGVDMSAKDYYADWSQSALLGSTPLNVYDPQYGTVAAADIPQWDRTQDIHERGVNYNNSYSSLYVQDELGFFENKVRLALAARYTENRTINPYSGNTKNDRITPRASLSVSLDKNSSVYAMYDQVFYGNTGIDYLGNSFDPVLGSNMEVGYKKDWFGGKWNSVVALYTITKNNVLTTDTEHPNPVSGMYVFQRATGQQKVNGVEVDIKGSLTNNLDVIINYAFTDAYISKDSDADLVGTRVPGASKHIQNTWLKYKVKRGALQGFSLQTGYQFLGNRTSWYIATDDSQKMPDYFRWDAGIGYQKDKVAFNLLINNVLNDYLYSGGYSSGMYMWQTEPLRNYRFSVNYTF